MNPVTFNEPFKKFFSLDPSNRMGSNTPLIPLFSSAPLFQFETPYNPDKGIFFGSDDYQSNREVLFRENGCGRLPFPIIRVCMEMKTSELNDTINVVSLIGPSRKEKENCTWMIVDMKMREKNSIKGETFKVSAGMDAMIQIGYRLNLDGTLLCETTIFETKKWADITSEFSKDSRREISMMVVSRFLAFLYDVNSPANHIATVVPHKQGKSVEWRQARTHYVILDRRHKANDATIKVGSTVEHDDAKNKQKIAHSRRAHWRTYRSERYKNVKGTRRWMTSVWVGPKEWKDQGGSIYKLVR